MAGGHAARVRFPAARSNIAADQSDMNKLFKIAVVFIGTFAAGLVGMLFVGSGVGSWYAALDKPPLTPPELFFPLAWTVLYILMSLACAIVWIRDPQDAHTEGWVRFYFVQLLLNAGWTIFFFGFHTITVSLINTLVLGFFVVALTSSAWEIDKRVTYLMLPYAVWLFFAAYLIAGIWLLN